MQRLHQHIRLLMFVTRGVARRGGRARACTDEACGVEENGLRRKEREREK